MNILRVVLARFLRLVGVCIVVSFFSFMLLDLVPGDPVLARAGLNATPEVVAELRAEMGLDDPLLVRYWHWISDALQGDLGTSENDVSSVARIRSALPKTIELMVLGQLIGLGLAVPAAIKAAQNPGGRFDAVTSSLSFASLAVPAFVLGVYLQFWFAVRLGWLPAVATDLPSLFVAPLENIRQLALPSLTLGLGLIAVYLRLLRSDLLATLQEDFVLLARARGFSNRRVLWRHALRPSSLGTVTAIGLTTGGLIGGALIVETLFAIPGMGRLAIQAIFRQDYVLVQAVVLTLSAGFVLTNFVVDLLYAIIDPRIRHGAE